MQEIPETGGLWGSMAVWPGDGGYVYVPSVGSLEAFEYGTDESGAPHLSLVADSPENLGYGSGSPLVTSDGATTGSGIVWISQCSDPPGCEGSTLNAYAAVPVEGSLQLLWSGEIGVSTKFARPDASGGHIYVGTYDGHLLGFGPEEHTLTVTREGEAGGSVSSDIPGIECGSSCSHSFVDGTRVTLTAKPAAHAEFTGWSGGGCSGTGACVADMGSDVTVTATFAPIHHTIRVSTSGTGTGSVTSEPGGISCQATCSARFDEAGDVTLTATPGDSTVTWGGCTSATGDTCRVENLESDREIQATFSRMSDAAITKATITRRKRKATFRFTGVGVTKGFQCRLIGPGAKHHKKAAFSRCTSPRIYRHLRPGRYTFEVRVVNPDGSHSTPATRHFKI